MKNENKIKDIISTKILQNQSCRGIALALSRKGFKTVRKNNWTASSVAHFAKSRGLCIPGTVFQNDIAQEVTVYDKKKDVDKQLALARLILDIGESNLSPESKELLLLKILEDKKL